METEKIESILAVSTTGIGNMLLYTPVLNTLKRNFPSAKLTLLCGSCQAADVVSGSGMADEIWILDKRRKSSYAGIIKKARKKKFDLLVTSYLDRSLKVGIFAMASGAGRRLGYDYGFQRIFYNYRAGILQGGHEVEQNLELLRAFGIENIVFDTEFHTGEEAEAAAEKNFPPGSVAGIHPGSGTGIPGRGTKRWPAERFGEAARQLVERYGMKIAVFGGSEEKELAEPVLSKIPDSGFDFTGRFSLKETAAMIRRCSIFITNDSGLMHVAASFKVPVVAVFGPTIPSKNRPWKTQHEIVRLALDCSPCYDMKRFYCNRPACLEDIDPEKVVEACGRLMDEKNR